MKTFKLAIVFFLGVICIIGSATANYNPPGFSLDPLSNSRIINKSYDETWSALIQYTAGAFFGIENYEKESGLMTLSFGASNSSEYITGGLWELKGTQTFSGDYVDYCEMFANGLLDGRLNLVITEISASKTKVTVNARYRFQALFNPGTTNQTLETWLFDSNNCDTVNVKKPVQGTDPARTICPTHKVENTILDAISAIGD